MGVMCRLKMVKKLASTLIDIEFLDIIMGCSKQNVQKNYQFKRITVRNKTFCNVLIRCVKNMHIPSLFFFKEKIKVPTYENQKGSLHTYL